jgi:hypothetical protein
MHGFWKTVLLSSALLVPIALAPSTLRAEDHKYHDKQHNDDHTWNDNEDKAHRMWEQENHRKHRDFDKYKDKDQQAYWGWRHDHSDALLKIEVR